MIRGGVRIVPGVMRFSSDDYEFVVFSIFILPVRGGANERGCVAQWKESYAVD
jgi:hypothetical protein